jgi:hypothetical protein
MPFPVSRTYSCTWVAMPWPARVSVPPGHRIEGIMDEVEYHTAEGVRMKHRLPQSREALEL